MKYEPEVEIGQKVPFFKGLKVRVGNYRILHEIQDDVLHILIVKIGHRKDIYKNLS